MSGDSVVASTIPFQGIWDGVNPISPLQLLPIPRDLANTVFKKYHYLHSCPLLTVSFGVYNNGLLVGAVGYSPGSIGVEAHFKNVPLAEIIVLSRFWLSDTMPRNSESRSLACSLRFLRHRWKAVVSYADPAFGHYGGIYQATNWLYTGLSRGHYLVEADGQTYHARSLFAKYGTRDMKWLRSKGHTITLLSNEKPKHRYIFLLDKNIQLTLAPCPYPKRVNAGSGSEV